jgi:uncharacterized YigZ family protein
MIDAYRTIEAPAHARISRKKSRFLAFVYPVASLEEIEFHRAELRRSYHNATHHCSAHRLLSKAEPIAASDDDGEPSGSAGPPILQQLEGADLLDVCAVVVRYYGGTKLGVGGLVRAYTDAVAAALEQAAIVEKQVEIEVRVTYPADVTSGVMATIHRHAARVTRIEYDTRATAIVGLPPSRVAPFLDAMREATGARATTEVLS